MDIHALTASQLAYIIRLSVFMDNHQTQGNSHFTQILDFVRKLIPMNKWAKKFISGLRHYSAVL